MAKRSFKYESYITINEHDDTLLPIRIRMPEPPTNIKDIVGWDLQKASQKFSREPYPQRLIDLETKVKKLLTDENKSNRLNKVTTQKYLTKMHDLLMENQKDYLSEILWIQRQWEYREKGRWFFINGEARFVPGSHWFFMNYWLLDGTTIPEYRNGDRKLFLTMEHAATTTEDLDGNDMGYRTLLGVVQPKNRRYGASNKGLCFGYWFTTSNYGYNGGIQSFDEHNAKIQFKNKLIPSWKKLPWFFKPMFNGSENPARSIDFVLPSNKMDGDALESKFDYATTSKRSFYDGGKLHFIMMDEQGKTLLEDVHERHQVVKECLSLGGDFIGFMYSPSTVGEMKEQGGEAFFTLCSQSIYHDRVDVTGRTLSGLMVYFEPAYGNLEGFIDEYGEPVIDTPTPSQAKFIGKKMGAKQFLQSQLDALLEKGDAKSINTYYKRLELYPLQYMDCFRITGGGINFNQDNLDYAVMKCREDDVTIKGNLEWFNGEPDTKVIFKEDPDGRWEFSEIPIKEMTNQKIQVNGVWQPANLMLGMIGSDSTRFLKTSEIKQFKTPDKLSDAAMCCIKRRDKMIDGDDKPIEEWKTLNVVSTYLYRHMDNMDFDEDVLKTAIFFGYMVNPETNLESTYEHFMRRGYAGYLNYAVDASGKKANKPGTYSGEGTKQKMFSLLKTYIDYHGKRIKHIGLLKQMKSIQAIEQMTTHDEIAAINMALMGLDSKYCEILSGYNQDEKESEYGLNDWFMTYDY